MDAVTVTNQQLNFERPRREKGVLGCSKKVSQEIQDLSWALKSWGMPQGKGRCSTQGCCGKWSSSSTLPTIHL